MNNKGSGIGAYIFWIIIGIAIGIIIARRFLCG